MKKPDTLRLAEKPAHKMLKASNLPESVDWNAAGKVSVPGNQYSCGSCWAWTTASTLESLNAIENNLDKVPHYSVQYLLDCDDVNDACDGGWMLDAYDFTREMGIVAWDDYARTYSSRKNKCVIPRATTPKFRNNDAFEEDQVTNERLKELVAKQPVGIAIFSSWDCLGFYSSGVLMEKDCICSDPTKDDVNHAVTLVGYGKSERAGCSEYWLIRNSWGATWGE